MADAQKQNTKQLLMEELELRAMCAATDIANQASAITNNSVNDVYHSLFGTEGGGAAGVGMNDDGITAPANFQMAFVPAGTMQTAAGGSFVPDSGLGQITITTGANTLGISSFATPTAGPSRAGGTGDPNLAPPPEDGEQAAPASYQKKTSAKSWSPASDERAMLNEIVRGQLLGKAGRG